LDHRQKFQKGELRLEKDKENANIENKQDSDTENQQNKNNSEEDAENTTENKYSFQLKQMKNILDEYKDKFLRVVAEYENYRKRSEKEKLLIYSSATSNAIVAILPVIDNLELALKSIKSDDEEYQKGLNLVNSQLLDSLNKLNVKSFGKTGDKFDPDVHNAVSHIKDASEKESFISDVFQKGYMIGDKVIRHAMVQVTN
jgi:molecular chaperone GrpE